MKKAGLEADDLRSNLFARPKYLATATQFVWIWGLTMEKSLSRFSLFFIICYWLILSTCGSCILLTDRVFTYVMVAWKIYQREDIASAISHIHPTHACKRSLCHFIIPFGQYCNMLLLQRSLQGWMNGGKQLFPSSLSINLIWDLELWVSLLVKKPPELCIYYYD